MKGDELRRKQEEDRAVAELIGKSLGEQIFRLELLIVSYEEENQKSLEWSTYYETRSTFVEYDLLGEEDDEKDVNFQKTFQSTIASFNKKIAVNNDKIRRCRELQESLLQLAEKAKEDIHTKLNPFIEIGSPTMEDLQNLPKVKDCAHAAKMTEDLLSQKSKAEKRQAIAEFSRNASKDEPGIFTRISCAAWGVLSALASALADVIVGEPVNFFKSIPVTKQGNKISEHATQVIDSEETILPSF